MKSFVQNRYELFLNSLEVLPNVRNLQVKNPAKIADLLKAAIGDLKAHYTRNPFPDQYSEILFFKLDKPKFYKEYIFASELFTIESNKPAADELKLKAYYEQELGFIRRFLDQHRFLYQYYLLDGNELDSLYFTVGQSNTEFLLPESPDTDPAFSAPADFIFAKFMALEKLQDCLMEILYPSGNNSHHYGREQATFHWSGDKINLIELAYGIYNTAQVNDGEVTIGELISWLENSFKVKLSRSFQMFSEIKNRKSVSKTRYLDHMIRMINRHIEMGDAFVPEKPKAVSGSKPASKT